MGDRDAMKLIGWVVMAAMFVCMCLTATGLGIIIAEGLNELRVFL